MTIQSAECRRCRRDWFDAWRVNSFCWESRREWNDDVWLIELRREDKNDYRIWLESLSFRRRFCWFRDWSFWDLDEKWFFAFFLDSDDRRNTIDDLVEAQHSINVIFFVLYEHDRKRSWNQLLSFRDRLSFHSVVDCLDSSKMSEKELSFRVDFVRDDWFVDHRRTISKITDCLDQLDSSFVV
jgi:hypothetical protein